MRRRVLAVVTAFGLLGGAAEARASDGIEGRYESVEAIDATRFGGPSSTRVTLVIRGGRAGEMIFTPADGSDVVRQEISYRFDKAKRKLAVKVAGHRVSDVFAETNGEIAYAGVRWRRSGDTDAGSSEPVPATPTPTPTAPTPPSSVDTRLVGLWAASITGDGALLVQLDLDGRARLGVYRGGDLWSVRPGTWTAAGGTLETRFGGVVLRGAPQLVGRELTWAGIRWNKQ